MLKFLNRNEELNRDLEFAISMSSVQGGVQVEADRHDHDMNEHKQETILLTPMDAALFAHETRVTNGLACPQVGHGSDGKVLQVSKIIPGHDGEEWRFVGCASEVFIEVGDIRMTAPTFVVDAMRLAIERMMETLLYHTTGDMEEEFG